MQKIENDKGVIFVYKLFLSILGAIIFRVRGGLSPALPRPFDQMLFALPYAAIIYKRSGRNIFWFIVVLFLTTLALMTGHGQYMDLGNHPVVGTGVEMLDFIVSLFFGEDKGGMFWRDLFGLCLTGLVVTLPCGIALLFFKEWVASAIIGLSGTLKGFAYVLSDLAGYGTEGGEYLTGFFLWGVVIVMWNKLKEEEK